MVCGHFKEATQPPQPPLPPQPHATNAHLWLLKAFAPAITEPGAWSSQVLVKSGNLKTSSADERRAVSLEAQQDLS